MNQFQAKHLLLYVFLFSNFHLNSQVLPSSRSCNWESSGLSTEPLINPATVNILSVGGDNSGNSSNDNAFLNALNHPSLVNGGTIYFPTGTYRFQATLEVYNRNGIIVKGDGAEATFFKFYSNEYQSSWQWDAMHFRGNLSEENYPLSANANIGSNIITLQNANGLVAGDYIKMFQEDFSGIDCLSGNNLSVTGSGNINNCEARHSLAHFSKVIGKNGNTLTLDNPIRFAYETSWNARVRKFEPAKNCGVENLSLEFLGLTQEKWQPKSIYMQLCAESWIKNVYSYNTGFGHFVVASSSNVEIINCTGHQDFFGGMGGGRGYGIVFEYGSNYCLAENNVLHELRHPLVVQSGANTNVFGYNFSKSETGIWADIVLHGNYPYLNLFEGNVGEVYRGDNSGHGENGPYNTFFRNRATEGITEFSGSTFNQNYIGNEIDGAYNINPNENFVFGNIVNGSSTQSLSDISYYRDNPLPFDQQCAWPPIGFPNEYGDYETPAQLRYEYVSTVAEDAADCNLNYNFNIIQNSDPNNPNGAISLASNNPDIELYWHDFDQLGGSISNLSEGCYSVFIWNNEGCYNTESFEIFNEDAENITLDLQVKLQGPYNSNSGLMDDNLRMQSTFPLESPYWLTENFVLGGDEEIMNTSILQNQGSNAIVDWIFVEMRDGQNPNEVIETKSALLQRDGDVVSAHDGVSNLKFHDHSSEYSSFVLAVNHRNHLSIRTNSPLTIQTTSPIVLDFSSITLSLYGGNDVMANVNGERLLKSGDALRDGAINALDINNVWLIQNGQLYEYFDSQSDLNLDGVVNSIDKNLHWRLNNGSAQNVD